MVGRVIHVGDAYILLVAMTATLTATRGDRAIEGCKGIDEFRIGGSMHEPSMDTMKAK